ncbi:hypothetical protein ACSZNF_12985 [Aeromonas hydrophila]
MTIARSRQISLQIRLTTTCWAAVCDVGGHVQACCQGGTCDSYNPFPQDKNFNNSAYKVFYENKIKRALDDPSKTVGQTKVVFVRDNPEPVRPTALTVTLKIDSVVTERTFLNEAGKSPGTSK